MVTHLQKQPIWGEPRRGPRKLWHPMRQRGAGGGDRPLLILGATQSQRVFNPLQSPLKPLLSSETQQLRKQRAVFLTFSAEYRFQLTLVEPI